jgi:glyoxylase-like metal-dependent hydrolase (beta-lactamase superfamily II)
VTDFVQIRGVIVHHHFLFDDDGVYLIDGGFIGGVSAIGKVLKERGLVFEDIKCILLTHGHLDHTLNVARLQELSGCQVYALLLDREHVEGRYRNRGWAKVVQAMEWVGRTILRYRIPKVAHWFEGGEVIEVWGVMIFESESSGESRGRRDSGAPE